METAKLTDLLEHITLLKTDLEGMNVHDAMGLGMYWANPYVINHLKSMQLAVYTQLRKGLTKRDEGVILVDPQEPQNDQAQT